MGRVTVEKCLDSVESHFDLVLLATEQAKQISKGEVVANGKKAFKTHVAALRMIENEDKTDTLKEDLIKRLNEDILEDSFEEEVSPSNNLLEEVVNAEFIIGESASINEIEDDLTGSGLIEPEFKDTPESS